MTLKQMKVEDALWVAHVLFERNSVTGSTGNLSFVHDDTVYMSESGSCFGRLSITDFAKITRDGTILEGNPSKEYPLHLAMYRNNPTVQAVLHTHSPYTTWLSCLEDVSRHIQNMLRITPYLGMLTHGNIGTVDYAHPGSAQLFDRFESSVVPDTNTYLLNNHGIFIGASTIMGAFNLLEEFESTAHLYYTLNTATSLPHKNIP